MCIDYRLSRRTQQFDKAITVAPCLDTGVISTELGLCMENNRSILRDGESCDKNVMISTHLTSTSDQFQLWSLCHPQISGPLKRHCDQLDDQVISFNGDDRIILFQDLDGGLLFVKLAAAQRNAVRDIPYPPAAVSWGAYD